MEGPAFFGRPIGSFAEKMQLLNLFPSAFGRHQNAVIETILDLAITFNNSPHHDYVMAKRALNLGKLFTCRSEILTKRIETTFKIIEENISFDEQVAKNDTTRARELADKQWRDELERSTNAEKNHRREEQVFASERGTSKALGWLIVPAIAIFVVGLIRSCDSTKAPEGVIHQNRVVGGLEARMKVAPKPIEEVVRDQKSAGDLEARIKDSPKPIEEVVRDQKTAGDPEANAEKAIAAMGGWFARRKTGETAITFVTLSNSRITDAGLKDIGGLTSLRILYLSDTAVTDAGLRELAGFQNLQTLALVNTKITDSGLKELTRLQNLTFLDLGKTGITDSGLKELTRLQSLQHVDLWRTNVTEVGVAKLLEALPKCNVVR